MAKFNTGSATIDKFLEIKKADEGFYKFVGEENFISLVKSVHPADLEKLNKAVCDLKEEGHCMIAYRIRRVDGKFRWVLAEFEYEPIEYDGEQLINVNFQDVQGLEREMNEIKSVNMEYGEYFSLLDEFFFVYDIDEDDLTIFIGGNKQRINLVHSTLEEWRYDILTNGEIGKNYEDVFEKFCNDLRTGGRYFSYELMSSHFSANNEFEMNLIKGKTILNASRERKVIGCISTISEETGKKEVNYNIEANIDAATGVLNKKAVTNYAKQIISAAPTYSVHIAIVDLDNFKTINDTYGHMFGDEVLVTVANILKDAVAGRGVVGRIGGDEMMVVLEKVDSHSELRGILRAIRSNVEWAYKSKLEGVNLTTSIGVASYPTHARTYEDVFKIADKMLYRAKSKGKNRYIIYVPEIHGDVLVDSEAVAKIVKQPPKVSKEEVVIKLAEFFLHQQIMPYEIALEEVIQAFGLDEINIFYDRLDRFMSEWNVDGKRVDREICYVEQDNFSNLFSENGLAVVNYIEDIQNIYNGAYEYLSGIGVTSAVIYKMNNSKKPGYVAFYRRTKTTGRKWTDTDKAYLNFIGKFFELSIDDK